jgi:hypothetical protein
MPTITPPTVDEQIIRGLAYMFTAGIGAAVLTTSLHGTLIERQLGFVSVVWALFMLSGVPAAVCTLLGNYRLEYVLLPCFTAALLVANLLVWASILFGGADDSAIPRACTASALVLMLAWRWRTLHRLIRVLQWTKPPAKH